MGKRINYYIGDLPSVILYSNSSHPTEDPENAFKEAVKRHPHSQTNLVRELLNMQYKTEHGMHRTGNPMFTVDLDPGDRELVYAVSYPEGAKPCNCSILTEPHPRLDV